MTGRPFLGSPEHGWEPDYGPAGWNRGRHRFSNTELLDFTSIGELPAGHDIASELDVAMEPYGGSLQYWKPGAEVGTRQGFDKNYFQRKFDTTVDILRSKGVDVDTEDIEKSQAFIDDVFDTYTGAQLPYRGSGSFAFVAATRIKRRDPNEFSPVDYRKESFGCLPVLRHLDKASAQKVTVGLPPFALDYYGKEGVEGGAMIFAPLFLDLVRDTGRDFITVGVNVAQETTWFAEHVLGVKVMSLAALLPLHTGMGKLFESPGSDMTITTGHAITTWTIGQVVERALREGRVSPDLVSRFGVLGVGGIGNPAAHMLMETMPDAQIMVHDKKRGKQAEVAEALQAKFGKNRVLEAACVEDVLRFGGVTVSAITGTIDLRTTNLEIGELEGRLYADDSQPAAVSAEQTIEYGGLHVGVVAEDPSGYTNQQRFNYGGMGPKDKTNAYGCCLEGATLYHADRRDLALTRPVTADDVRVMGKLAAELGFGAAPLQTLLHGRAQEV